jgi:hypothetical protein
MRADRGEQIEHLAELSRRRNIDLRIQQFEDGPPTGLSMVSVFGFPDDEPSIDPVSMALASVTYKVRRRLLPSVIFTSGPGNVLERIGNRLHLTQLRGWGWRETRGRRCV